MKSDASTSPAVDKKWLACFRLKTNLRVEAEEETLHSALPGYEVFLTNVPYDKSGVYYLDLKVVFRAADLDTAGERSRTLADEYVYGLSFVSGAAVRVDRPVYLIDWDPGVTMRDEITYGTYQHNDPIDALSDTMLASVEAVFTDAGNPLYATARAAMPWYARGARAYTLEDRYLYYFFVIEMLASAETYKKVVDLCPHCGHDLVCTHCGKQPEHRPFPKQRIKMLLEQVGIPGKLAERMIDLRNLLSHGTEVAEIKRIMRKDSPDFELALAVDTANKCAVRVLHRAFGFDDRDSPLTFYYLEQPEGMHVTARSHMRVGLPGDPNNPKFQDVVMPTFSIILTDPKTGEEEVRHIPVGNELEDRGPHRRRHIVRLVAVAGGEVDLDGVGLPAGLRPARAVGGGDLGQPGSETCDHVGRGVEGLPLPCGVDVGHCIDRADALPWQSPRSRRKLLARGFLAAGARSAKTHRWDSKSVCRRARRTPKGAPASLPRMAVNGSDLKTSSAKLEGTGREPDRPSNFCPTPPRC